MKNKRFNKFKFKKSNAREITRRASLPVNLLPSIERDQSFSQSSDQSQTKSEDAVTSQPTRFDEKGVCSSQSEPAGLYQPDQSKNSEGPVPETPTKSSRRSFGQVLLSGLRKKLTRRSKVDVLPFEEPTTSGKPSTAPEVRNIAKSENAPTAQNFFRRFWNGNLSLSARPPPKRHSLGSSFPKELIVTSAKANSEEKPKNKDNTEYDEITSSSLAVSFDYEVASLETDLSACSLDEADCIAPIPDLPPIELIERFKIIFPLISEYFPDSEFDLSAFVMALERARTLGDVYIEDNDNSKIVEALSGPNLELIKDIWNDIFHITIQAEGCLFQKIPGLSLPGKNADDMVTATDEFETSIDEVQKILNTSNDPNLADLKNDETLNKLISAAFTHEHNRKKEVSATDIHDQTKFAINFKNSVYGIYKYLDKHHTNWKSGYKFKADEFLEILKEMNFCESDLKVAKLIKGSDSQFLELSHILEQFISVSVAGCERMVMFRKPRKGAMCNYSRTELPKQLENAEEAGPSTKCTEENLKFDPRTDDLL